MTCNDPRQGECRRPPLLPYRAYQGPAVALSRAQAREVDHRAQRELGIPSSLLMEAAGIRAADEILDLLRIRSRPVDILVGTGNNGGDGLVVARHLAVSGVDVRILTPLGSDRLRGGSGDAAVNYGICKRAGIPLEEGSWKELLVAPNLGLRRDALVVDALLGTGATRPLEGDFLAWVRCSSGLAQDLVSLDIPSGLDCDTGLVLGAALRAATTITFVASKVGFALNDGPAHVGRVVVADIGIGGGMLR